MGVFSPTEAAGVGAFLALLLALWRRRGTGAALTTVMLQTIRTTALAFLIIVGAHIFSPFIALTEIPENLAAYLTDGTFSHLTVLFLILVTYIILGTFLEGFAMLVLTLPIVHPLIVALGYDPIWFGVTMVIVLEMGLISPPVGVNVFVVKGIAEDVPLSQIFLGILPFWVAMGVCLALLVAFPNIALFLPNTMFGS